MSSRTEYIYTRALDMSVKSSLSVLAHLVTPGSRVLDIGIGGGALGAYLQAQKGCAVDGITYSSAEAGLASAHYRSVHVADLDCVRLPDLVQPQCYDFIICADILEHLREPERILDDAKSLLTPHGSLLISVPNASYMGLIAELMGGELQYRLEGLLDQTHVRFFTRNSMLRLLCARGWTVEHTDSIVRNIADSEFQPSLELLPPAVSAQLLAGQDSLVYQLIFSAKAQAAQGDTRLHPHLLQSDAPQAHYVLQLYYASADTTGYSEECKVQALARIGENRQDVVFPLPQTAMVGLRLDPADRPGFLYLHGITLQDSAQGTLWSWDGDISSLLSRSRQLLPVSPTLQPCACALLLVGDDPQISLDIPAELLQRACGGRLHVSLSWPMSADYKVVADRAASALRCSEEKMALQRSEYEDALSRLSTEHSLAVASLAQEQISISQQLSEALAQHQTALSTIDQQRSAISEQRSIITALENSAKELDALRSLHQQVTQKQEQMRAFLDSARKQSLANADALNEARRINALQLDHNQALRRQIDDILQSRILRLTRPLLRAKESVDALLHPSHQAISDKSVSVTHPYSPTVDIIVPVYRGLVDTRCCVESVLRSSPQTGFRLVLINDCSPEPEVTAYLRSVAPSDPRILLLENDINLGFVGTVNRGMALNTEHDVLLLNSDAEVANDWLDRIRSAAYAAPKIGSVTPLSNNATICSYPRFCEANELPPDCSTSSLDTLCRATNPKAVVDVPTGVGFCMYIRRECLNEVGLFDVTNFGKGYGEENDFCMRSSYTGWRHLLLLDTFVRHAGGVSFGEAKTPREREAVEKLRRLHPTYDRLVHDHVSQNPAQLARLKIDLARIRALGRPAILFVTHSRGGGTERHVRELASLLSPYAVCFGLRPSTGGITQLNWIQDGEAFQLDFRLPTELDGLIELLRGLGVAHIHFHHLIGHDPSVWGLADRLGVAHDFTAHDFYAACPQITLTDAHDRYCEERGTEQCGNCLQRRPAPGNPDISQWRANYAHLLGSARFVLAPSSDAAARIARYFPKANVRVAPHRDLLPPFPTPGPALIGSRALRVAVIGALSPIKGADMVEAVAKLAASQKAPVEFHLLGYGYRPLLTQPKAALSVHGAYEESELDALLQWLKPDIVWFPALWPETYSYTLSACLKVGLPVAVPDIGAFKERIAGRPWSWVMPWAATPQEWLHFFGHIAAAHYVSGTAPSAAPQTAAEQPVADFEYVDEYISAIVQRGALPCISDETVSKYANLPPAGLTAVARTARGHVALRLSQLKRSHSLRWLARVVPLHWQTRLKTWLLK